LSYCRIRPIAFVIQTKTGAAGFITRAPNSNPTSGDDFRYPPGANRAAAFANCEPLAFFHRYRRDDLHFY